MFLREARQRASTLESRVEFLPLKSSTVVTRRAYAVWSTLTGRDTAMTEPPPARSEILATPP